MKCRMVAVCVWLTAAAAAASEQLTAARTAQCRALCLDEYHVATGAPHTECLRRRTCLTCWEKCSSLNPAGDDDGSTSCDLLPDCESVGCQLACEFHASPPVAPPLRVSRPPLLELSWDGSEARWTLAGSNDGPTPANVVFLLLAGTPDGWKELVQTSEASVVLANMRRDTPLRLLAVSRAGQLAATDAVLRPLPTGRPPLLDREDERGDEDSWLYRSEPRGAWLLETVSMARDDNMVLVKIGWRPQETGSTPAEYLVTWEVSGGGIKGHLYTDMTSVTLSLWPESVYNIQVELLSPSFPRSVPLVISTYRQQAAQLVKLQPGLQMALAVLVSALLVTALVLVTRWCRWRHRRPSGGVAGRVFTLSPAVRQKMVPSPLRSVLVKTCHAPAPVHAPPRR